MPDRARLQVKTVVDPETWVDVGVGEVGENIPVKVEESVLPDGASTSGKQDLILTQLSNLITELQQKTEPTDIQSSELIPVLRYILTVIANPSYVDKSANQMRAQVTGSLTTVTTVTNVTNLSNIGSYSADHLQRMANINAWAANVRNLIT